MWSGYKCTSLKCIFECTCARIYLLFLSLFLSHNSHIMRSPYTLARAHARVLTYLKNPLKVNVCKLPDLPRAHCYKQILPFKLPASAGIHWVRETNGPRAPLGRQKAQVLPPDSEELRRASCSPPHRRGRDTCALKLTSTLPAGNWGELP